MSRFRRKESPTYGIENVVQQTDARQEALRRITLRPSLITNTAFFLSATIMKPPNKIREILSAHHKLEPEYSIRDLILVAMIDLNQGPDGVLHIAFSDASGEPLFHAGIFPSEEERQADARRGIVLLVNDCSPDFTFFTQSQLSPPLCVLNRAIDAFSTAGYLIQTQMRDHENLVITRREPLEIY